MAEKNETASKKPNIFVRMGRRIAKFFRDYSSEMKKVVWLSRKETVKSSVLVTIVVVVTAIVIGLIDAGFTAAIQALGALY